MSKGHYSQERSLPENPSVTDLKQTIFMFFSSHQFSNNENVISKFTHANPLLPELLTEKEY